MASKLATAGQPPRGGPHHDATSMIPFLQRWILTLAPPLALPLMLASLVAIFFWVPSDETLGFSQRIFYWHVPAATDCYLAFGFSGLASAIYLKTRRADWDYAAHAAVSVGMTFATIVIVTGSIWGHTAWGTWWTWDARLATFLILWLEYAAYLMLRNFARDNEMAPRYAAVLAIMGTVTVPLVMMATRIFRTIHPQVIRNPEGGIDDPRMVTALLVSFVAFLAMILWLWALRLAQLRIAGRIELLEGDLHA